MATHTITIVETEKGLLVVPPYVVADRHDDLRFVNLTTTASQVLVAAETFLGVTGEIFPVSFGSPQVRPIDVGERKGSFPYQIYVESEGPVPALRTRRFAVGKSAPHVIIE